MKQIEMAGGRGFEPLLAESESAVLPLDEPPMHKSVVPVFFIAGIGTIVL